MTEPQIARCLWCGADPLYTHYHDTEWGVPLYGERAFFERICLEGAQAGLSWITILRKRERYRELFDGFEPALVAAYGDARIAVLLAEPGIVRNRAKIASCVSNAQAFIMLQERVGGVSDYLWSFVGGTTQRPHRAQIGDVPAITPESAAMSAALRQHGFTFVGPTICYALMQATGMVNDHLTTCFRHGEL